MSVVRGQMSERASVRHGAAGATSAKQAARVAVHASLPFRWPRPGLVRGRDVTKSRRAGIDPRVGTTPGLDRAAGLEFLGACSSVGQSARLISVRSAVQIGPGPPFQRSEIRGRRSDGVWPRIAGSPAEAVERLLTSGIPGHRNGVRKDRCRRQMSAGAAAREGRFAI
jgi:hypothetical protein